MDEKLIQDFISANQYDIRKTNNGRWIDQKCTMDVICLVSDCIKEYTKTYPDSSFSIRDIWHYDYTVKNVQEIFSKPNPSLKASREYDKYFGQPIKLLEAAGILQSIKSGTSYLYSVVRSDILEHISIRDRNSFVFLCFYIEKVLKDSGIYQYFEDFFIAQDKNSYKDLRDNFVQFTINNTNINGETECRRIFTKVLNPLACRYNKLGTELGHISSDIISFNDIIYNQKNWRDILSSKPKSLSREDYEKDIATSPVDKMTSYRIQRAKKNLRDFNDKYRLGKTEVYDIRHMQDLASQIHHIFSLSDYPAIGDYIENLIALTPTQHYLYAHPNNNTSYIDKNYQYLCLLAKTEIIRGNLLNNKDEPKIYDFGSFQTVLNTGLDTNKFYTINEMDFTQVLELIEEYYV